jgi:predicted flap endonuclease-1-like 5' DNA nuclease
MSLEPKVLFGSFTIGPAFSAFSGPNQDKRQPSGALGLMHGLLYVAAAMLASLLLTVLLLWWWINRRAGQREPTRTDISTPLGKIRLPVPMQAKKSTPPELSIPTPAPAADATMSDSPALPAEDADSAAKTEEAPPEPPTPDDLKRIRGIGPKTADLLQSAGILTYAQLAATGVGDLRDLLADAGLSSIINPTTWPEQAQLAAEDDWDALKTLQEELKSRR